LADFDKAITLNEKDGEAYYTRGLVKKELKKTDFCEDWKKALELGYTKVEAMLKEQCK
jgi:hypothetical protein